MNLKQVDEVKRANVVKVSEFGSSWIMAYRSWRVSESSIVVSDLGEDFSKLWRGGHGCLLLGPAEHGQQAGDVLSAHWTLHAAVVDVVGQVMPVVDDASR